MVKITHSARLRKDYQELYRDMKTNDENVCFECDGSLESFLEDYSKFSILLRGPPDTPYAGGKFRLCVSIPNDYPFKPPSILFDTKIYHPNIYNKEICIDILDKNWSPAYTLTGLLNGISSLLDHPNPNDPLDTDVGNTYKNNPSDFKKKAIEYTKKYAIKDERRNYLSM